VHCPVVFAGLWLRRVSGCGLGVGLGWCLPGRGCVGFPVAGQGPKSGWDVPGRGRIGFPVAARGSFWVGVYRAWLHWVRDCGLGVESGCHVPDRGSGFRLRPGVESGWYVPGRCRVGFPIAGRGSNQVSMYRVVVASGFRLWLGVGLGQCLPG